MALLAHWRRRPDQLATLLIGLLLATALWSAVQAINGEARASYGRAAGLISQGAHDTLTDPDGPIALPTFVALRRAGWLVSPVLEGRLLVGDTRLTVIGLELLTAPPGALPVMLGADNDINPLRLIGPDGIGFAAPSTIARLAAIADLPPLEPSALIMPGRIYTDIGTAERLLDRPGQITRLTVLPDQPAARAPLAEVAPNLKRSAAEDDAGRNRADVTRLTNSFHLNLTAFGLLSFAVGLFIVHGAIGLAFEQRRGTIRTLRALGLPLRDLIVMLLAELLVLALIAGAAGVALGYVIAGALLPDVAATLRGLYGANVPGSLDFDPIWALVGLAIAVAGALIAGAQGLWRVYAMPLLASAQPRAWATVSAGALRRQAVAGIALIVMGVAAALLADGLMAGFSLLGGLLLGAALLLPAVLAAALALGARMARTAESQWFWADTRQQLPGLSLALMALLLALATNIGVATMVGSFRLTFSGWLDQRLAAELYVAVADAAESARLADWLDGRTDGVLPVISIDARIAGAPGEINGIVDHPTYRENWPLLAAGPDVWDRLAAGQTALINEQLALRENLAPGDLVDLAPGWRMPVGAIYSDYGNPLGQAMVSLDLIQSRYRDQVPLNFGLRTDQPEALAAALGDQFGLNAANIIDQATIKRRSLQVFERTFTVTGALNILTLSVAGLAILTALLTLASVRLPQLAPAWALGITRHRLARLEILRSLSLAALTFIAAVPLGLAVAWVLLAVVNVEAFGWRLPMHVFPLQWLWLLALALAAATIAAALPARRLARTAPARFLKVFADER